jgi:hypothetical protein
MKFQRGAELWALFFEARHSRWRPSLLGRVERVDGVRGALVAGKWYSASLWPAFSSQDEAEAWARANPLNLPTAPSEFGNVR